MLVGAVAALLYSNFLLDALFSPDHDWLAVVSELEVPGQPTATLLRTTDVLCSLLTLLLVPHVRAALSPGPWRAVVTWSIVAFAVGGILAAAVPLPCAASEVCSGGSAELQRSLHDGASIVSALALFVSAGAIAVQTSHDGPVRLHRLASATFWVGGVLGSIAFLFFGLQDAASWQTGLSQRFQIVVMSAWILCLGLVAAQVWRRPTATRTLDGEPPAHRVW